MHKRSVAAKHIVSGACKIFCDTKMWYSLHAGKVLYWCACSGHKSTTNYWRAGHNVLLAHAAAVQRFRQVVPDGKIGIVANSDFFEPLTNSTSDNVCSSTSAVLSLCAEG